MALIIVKRFFEKCQQKYNQQQKSVRYAVPFILFIVCASFGMTQITEIRYKYRRNQTIREKVDGKEIELKSPKEITLEAQYEEIKELDIDNWENKRIERPYE